ncbi:obscurin-like [Uloborus diversus]|uniref:obscurin-like n=1 Tax=Uloborus diversus TaxID=327109 RepID=UPI002409ECB9|nr:obscurin-like [Uloborus diversus]
MSEEKAAEKIQASFRGYKTRKSLKNNGVVPAKENINQNQTKGEVDGKLEKLQEQPEEKPASKPISKSEQDELLDIDLTDKDLEKAATKIQASYRNFTKKKQDVPQPNPVENSTPQENEKTEIVTVHNSNQDEKEDQSTKEQEENLDDIDLKDPEVEKAALKIQSTFRGYKSRREVNPEIVQNGEKEENQD